MRAKCETCGEEFRKLNMTLHCAECRGERNRQRIREKSREQHILNREKVNERKRKYRAAHPEKVRKWNVKYRADRTFEATEYWRKYYAAHAEKERERSRDRYAADPGKSLARKRRRRGILRAAKLLGIPPLIYAAMKIVERSNQPEES